MQQIEHIDTNRANCDTSDSGERICPEASILSASAQKRCNNNKDAMIPRRNCSEQKRSSTTHHKTANAQKLHCTLKDQRKHART